MRFSSIKLPTNSSNDGITIGTRFNGTLDNLGKVVVLTGANGSGKSRFIKLLQKNFEAFKNDPDYQEICFKIAEKDENNKDIEEELTKATANSIHLINYSHFDAKLQGTVKFSPYVIHQAKNKLKQCNYEETALNSLLFLKDLAEGYSEESNESNEYKGLQDFIEFAKDLELEFSWDQEKKVLKIFNRTLDDAKLSPGQLYALRIAVACQAHEVGDNFVFLLDEPETHLHPSLLVKIITKLLTHFKDAQFFISTHSLPLISYLTVTVKDTTVFYMEKGEVKDRLRSNSEPILNNLIGTEDEQFAIKQLFASSDEMACNKFCMECFLDPTVLKGGTQGDPSAVMAENNMNPVDTSDPLIVVDYGAGQGRLLECMLEDNFKTGYHYNAYNIEKDDANYCQKLIENAAINGKSFLDKNDLAVLNGTVDRVFMVNVLHEISPDLWKSEFDTISKLLKEDGKLIIIERENLTMGESPFLNGFLMLTGIENRSAAAEALFGESNISITRHHEKQYIIAYTVEKSGVCKAQDACLEDVFRALQNDALNKITELRKNKATLTQQKDKYKSGLSLAFWLNQLSCAIACSNDIHAE